MEGLDSKILEKIRKLVRLQESATKIGSLEEAGNAAAKIQSILMQHNMEIHQLNLEDPDNKKEEPIEKEGFSENLSNRHEGSWIMSLYQVIAKHNLCYVLGKKGDSSYITLIGTPTNKAVTTYTVEQLVNRIRPLAKEAFKNYRGTEKRNTFIRGFLQGAAVGIGEQLDAKAQEERAAAERAATISEEMRIPEATNALMTMNMVKYERERVTDYLHKNFRFSHAKGPSYKGQSGRAQGIETGRNMSINAGISGRSNGSNKLLG